MLRERLALLCLVTAACGGGPAKSANDDAVQINVALASEAFTLPNGLYVVFHRESSAASVNVHVRYDVGAKDDPDGRAGLAHLYEHLMFLGSRHTGEKDYGQWIEGVGGGSNATTSPDTTDYFESLPPSQLPLALWLESDRMAYPLAKVDDAALSKEREVVKNEWRERYENVAYGQVDLLARQAVFAGGHPYSHPPIGYIEELDRVTIDDAKQFARSYYRPNNATLVVAGAFDPKVARELVTKYFATIPPGPPRKPDVAPPVTLEADKSIEIVADVDAPLVAAAWPAPRQHADGFEELRFGMSVFCGQITKRLVVEKKTAREVECGVAPGRLASFAEVRVTLEPRSSAEGVMSVVDEYLTHAAEIGRVGTAWPGFVDMKTRWLVEATSSLETLGNRTNRILHDVDYHGVPDAMQADLKRLQSVEAHDVGAAVEQFVQRAHRVSIHVTPLKGAPRAGRLVRR
jgi:zinc protease